jgi:hypothetical protein
MQRAAPEILAHAATLPWRPVLMSRRGRTLQLQLHAMHPQHLHSKHFTAVPRCIAAQLRGSKAHFCGCCAGRRLPQGRLVLRQQPHMQRGALPPPLQHHRQRLRGLPAGRLQVLCLLTAQHISGWAGS